MFTGLIEEVGVVKRITPRRDSRIITYGAPKTREELKVGDSVAVDGVCQTVTALTRGGFSAEALKATLVKTTLGNIRVGEVVNLEKAMRANGRLDGHIVQGHVSGTAQIIRISKEGDNRFLHLSLNPQLRSGCIPEGSLAVDGISLTMAELTENSAVINVIPLTWETTTLKKRTPGDWVNIETDPLTRGPGQLMDRQKSVITKEKLQSWGF